jgi:hypothetical protein
MEKVGLPLRVFKAKCHGCAPFFSFEFDEINLPSYSAWIYKSYIIYANKCD